MTQSHESPPPDPTQDQQAREERLALKAMLALFVLAGLVIAVVTILGGGIGGD